MIGYRTRTVGTKLRRAREWRRISLRQVADSTKISVAVLQALERDDISYLPGGVVGRGFVRSFATAVKIDPEAIVAQFVAQFPQHSVSDGYPAAAVNEPPVPLRSEVREVPIKIYRSKGATLLRVAAVGLLPAGFALYYALHTRKPSALWGKIQRWAVTAPASLGAYSLKAEGPNPQAPHSLTPPQSAATVLPATVDAHAGSAAQPVVVPGRDSAAVTASTLPAAGTAGRSPANDTSSTAAKKNEKPPTVKVVNEPLKVALSVTSPSWVIASVDGKKTLNRMMDVGEEETLEAKSELVLTAGNGGAIVMTVNGAAAKSLGRTGKTVKVRVNHANFRNYLRRARRADSSD